jgi:predicted outer membrane protein
MAVGKLLASPFALGLLLAVVCPPVYAQRQDEGPEFNFQPKRSIAEPEHAAGPQKIEAAPGRPLVSKEESKLSPGQQQKRSDQRIADWIAVLNEAEIELAEYGRDRLHLGANRRWVDEAIADHQQLASSLRSFVDDDSVTPRRAGAAPVNDRHPNDRDPNNRDPNNRDPNNRDPNNRDPNNRDPYDRDPNNRDTVDQPEFDFHGAAGDVLEQTVLNLRRELRSQHGLGFDWVFLGQQDILQGQIAAEIRALRSHASPALQRVLARFQDTVLDHQDEIDALLAKTRRAEIRQRVESLEEHFTEISLGD